MISEKRRAPFEHWDSMLWIYDYMQECTLNLRNDRIRDSNIRGVVFTNGQVEVKEWFTTEHFHAHGEVGKRIKGATERVMSYIVKYGLSWTSLKITNIEFKGYEMTVTVGAGISPAQTN